MDAAQEFSRLSGVFYAEGEYRTSAGDRRTDVVDPAPAKVIGAFPTVTPDEVALVVAAANTAQAVWWAESALHRAEVLHGVAREIDRIAPEVA
jgi:acyl-CoA reductase-like NAD-dependent aldehyde dehydrogenase